MLSYYHVLPLTQILSSHLCFIFAFFSQISVYLFRIPSFFCFLFFFLSPLWSPTYSSYVFFLFFLNFFFILVSLSFISHVSVSNACFHTYIWSPHAICSVILHSTSLLAPVCHSLISFYLSVVSHISLKCVFPCMHSSSVRHFSFPLKHFHLLHLIYLDRFMSSLIVVCHSRIYLWNLIFYT